MDTIIMGFGFSLLAGLILFLLRAVFQIANKEEKQTCSYNPDANNKLSTIQKVLNQLFDMHNVKNQDGVPVWYTSRELTEATRANAKAIKKISEAVQAIAKSVERQEKSNERVIDHLLEERKNERGNRSGN